MILAMYGQYIEGNYEVLHSVRLAGGNVILAVNNLTAMYMVCDRVNGESSEIDEYKNIEESTDFVNMMWEFAGRIKERAVSIMNERVERNIPIETLTTADCVKKSAERSNLTGHVVVISSKSLAPEYRNIDYQLMFVTGGPGANPDAQIRRVNCINLYDGKKSNWNRGAIAGIISPERMPDWAQEKLAALQSQIEHITSRVDITEAFQVGGAAVKAAFEGITAQMVALKRLSDDPYQITTELIAINDVANKERKLPSDWITPDGLGVTFEFTNYVRPLIQAELTPIFVEGLPRHIFC